MGGALVGKGLIGGGKILSTAAVLLGNNSGENKYYRSLAALANAQAAEIEAAAKRNTEYIYQDSTYQNSRLAQNYAQLLGEQKATLAANGLNGHSETAQRILKNSRLNAQLDQELLQQNMDREIYETNTQAAFEATQQRVQAAQYESARRTANRNRLWSRISAVASNLLNWK